MKRRVVFGSVALCLGMLNWGMVASVLADQRREVSSQTFACGYQKGAQFVVTRVEYCSAPGCRYTVEGRLDELPIAISSLQDASPDVSASCKPGQATLKINQHVVALIWNKQTKQFALAPSLKKKLSDLTKSPEHDPGTYQNARVLYRTLQLVPTIVDRSLMLTTKLIFVRELLFDHRWLQASDILASIDEKTACANTDACAPLQAARQALHRLQSESMPVRIKAVRQILTLKNKPKLPHLDAAATVFWKANALCVIDDQNPKKMRCYSPQEHRWRLGLSAQTPKWPDNFFCKPCGAVCENKTRCDFMNCANDEKGACEVMQDQVVSIGAQDVLYIRHNRIIKTDPQDLTQSTPTPLVVQGAIKKGHGGELLGNGAYRIERNAIIRELGDENERFWVLTDDPALKAINATQVVSSLVSTQQNQILLVTFAGAKGYVLWLVELA